MSLVEDEGAVPGTLEYPDGKIVGYCGKVTGEMPLVLEDEEALVPLG